MITETTIHRCRKCNSPNLQKNGCNQCGNQQYHCKDCGSYRVLNPKHRYSESEKNQILKAYEERSSMRGIERTFGVRRQNLSRWIKKAKTLPPPKKSLLKVNKNDVLKLDELCSFVFRKTNQKWLWIALCRRRRQIVAFFGGDRSSIGTNYFAKKNQNGAIEIVS